MAQTTNTQTASNIIAREQGDEFAPSLAELGEVEQWLINMGADTSAATNANWAAQIDADEFETLSELCHDRFLADMGDITDIDEYAEEAWERPANIGWETYWLGLTLRALELGE